MSSLLESVLTKVNLRYFWQILMNIGKTVTGKILVGTLGVFIVSRFLRIKKEWKIYLHHKECAN